MKSPHRLLGVLFAASSMFARLQAAETVPYSFSASETAAPGRVELKTMPKMNNAKLAAAAEILDQTGPFYFAEAVDVSYTPATTGTWDLLKDGRAMWRLRLYSDGALSLNLGFRRYWMPPGGELFVYSADRKIVYGPFTDKDNEDHGELWTPIIDGEEIVIEVILPEDAVDDLELELNEVNHGYRDARTVADKSGSCNVDVICSQGDEWRDQIQSVAAYGTNGTRFCTGALINNTAQDGKPYFLTANHCGVTASEAPSILVYWNYQNQSCRTPGSSASGATGDGQTSQFNAGAIFRASYAPSDFTLLELDDPVYAQTNPYWAGWDRTGVDADSVVGIHHPNGQEKRISFSNHPTTITSYLAEAVPGNSTHIRVLQWDLGTTEPGSSGSPLFDENHRIIGQLHGGFAACEDTQASDWYGRFALSWTGGGTPETRLSDWLDPLGSGIPTLDGRPISDLRTGGSPVVDDTQGTGDGDGVVERGEGPILVHLPVWVVANETVTGVTSQLTSGTAGVSILQGVSDYPDIHSLQTLTNETAFEIAIGPEVDCGQKIQLRLAVQTDNAGEALLIYSIETGPDCDVIADFVGAGIVTLHDDLENGNDNGVADPGESALQLFLPIRNVGGDSVVASAHLESLTTTAHVLQPDSFYPQASRGDIVGNQSPFEVALDASHICAAPVKLQLTVSSTGGVQVISFSLPTGRLNSAQTLTTEVTIHPGVKFGLAPETVTIPIDVSTAGQVKDVNLLVDLTHTWDSDMDLYLKSPAGTMVQLFNELGENGDNLTNTVFDDEAENPISSGTAPFTGSFRPFQALSAIDGESLAGTWEFVASDVGPFDEGNVLTLTLTATYAPAICDPPLDLSLPGDVTGDGIVTPGDAQAAFECYITGSCAAPNAADVEPDDGDNCVDKADGNDQVTPADAQRIFETALGLKNLCP